MRASIGRRACPVSRNGSIGFNRCPKTRDQYSWLEQHAYEFAGRLLVPPERLNAEFAGAVEKAKKAGFASWDSSGDAAREYIANSICRVFGVSGQVIERRIDREKLWPPA